MKRERTPTGEAATELILSAFRANGLLLDAGDMLSVDEGLTSARWQVLGAIALVLSPTRCTMWRFSDNAGGTIDLTKARKWADGLL